MSEAGSVRDILEEGRGSLRSLPSETLCQVKCQIHTGRALHAAYRG